MSTITEEMRDVGPWGQAVALSFRFLLLGAVVVAIGWMVSNVRQIPPDSQAIIVRLGTVARVQGPGLLIAFPRPIDEITLIPASARQIQFTISRFVDNEPSSPTTATYGFDVSDSARLNSGFLLSGDSSVVHLEAQIFYQISDPQEYLVAMSHVGPALQRLFIASAVNTVASRDLDTILVARPEIAARNAEATQRERLRIDLMNAVNRRLMDLSSRGAGLGITVSRVDLVPSIPTGAKEAFDSVLVVTQEAEANIAMARTNAQFSMQTANSTRDRIKTDATASAEEMISNAQVSTASISALAQSSHDMSHAMQMSRLYYDRIGPIIAKARRVQVIGQDGTSRILVPGAMPQ